jgi:hypothetical protein
MCIEGSDSNYADSTDNSFVMCHYCCYIYILLFAEADKQIKESKIICLFNYLKQVI